MTEAQKQLSSDTSTSKKELSSLTRTTLLKTMVRCGTCFGLLLFVGNIHAQSLIVAVSSAQFTTYVEAQGWPVDTYPPISRTTTSASPLGDEIDQPDYEYVGTLGIGTNHSIANAGVFGVSAKTGSGFANASATSQIRFSPLVDQTQAISIQFSPNGNWLQNTSATISLSDLTSGSAVWSYSIYDNNVLPLVFASPDGVGVLNLDTDFHASDQYELTMMTGSDAGDDSEGVQIQLTGLQAVPEPSTTLFLAMCGASFIISRRQRS